MHARLHLASWRAGRATRLFFLAVAVQVTGRALVYSMFRGIKSATVLLGRRPIILPQRYLCNATGLPPNLELAVEPKPKRSPDRFQGKDVLFGDI